jgi:hypothetical protein
MSDPLREFEPIQSFEIDDGSLDNLRPALVFTLGVEWQVFYTEALKPAGEFSRLIHAENVDRVMAMLRKHGWKVKVTPGNGEFAEIAGAK